MIQVVVIGGRGYLGSKVFQELEQRPDVTAVSPSKDQLCLHDPASYSRVKDFQVIVICAETDLTRKIKFIEFCLENGKQVIESSADPATIRGLTQRFDGKIDQGALLLGMGVFPGLSNILVAHFSKLEYTNLDLVMSTSPFAGAGNDMCELMIKFLMHPTPWPSKHFELGLNFPEVEMLSRTAPQLCVQTFFRPKPRVIVPFLKLLRFSRLLHIRWISKLMSYVTKTMRTKLFYRVATPIKVIIRSRCKKTLGELTAADGVQLAVQMIAYAACNRINSTGLELPDERFGLELLNSESWNFPVEFNSARSPN